MDSFRTLTIDEEIAKLLSREGPRWSADLDYAAQARAAAVQARRVARIAVNSMGGDRTTPRAGSARTWKAPPGTLTGGAMAAAPTPSPRAKLSKSRRLLGETPSPRIPTTAMRDVDRATREADLGYIRALHHLEARPSALKKKPDAAGPSTPRRLPPALNLEEVLAPQPVTPSPRRPQTSYCSPRVPCVQKGHHHLMSNEHWKAEPAYREELSAKEAKLGPNNPSTLSSVVSLADVLVLQLKHGEAAPLYKRVLAAKIAQLPYGAHWSNAVLDMAEKLAKAYRMSKKEAKALELEGKFGVWGGPPPPPTPPPEVVKAVEEGNLVVVGNLVHEDLVPPLSPETSTLAPSP